LNEDKRETLDAIVKMICQLLVTIAGVIAFFMTLWHLLYAETVFEVVKGSVIEVFFGIAGHQIFRHWLPVKRKD